MRRSYCGIEDWRAGCVRFGVSRRCVASRLRHLQHATHNSQLRRSTAECAAQHREIAHAGGYLLATSYYLPSCQRPKTTRYFSAATHCTAQVAKTKIIFVNSESRKLGRRHGRGGLGRSVRKLRRALRENKIRDHSFSNKCLKMRQGAHVKSVRAECRASRPQRAQRCSGRVCWWPDAGTARSLFQPTKLWGMSV